MWAVEGVKWVGVEALAEIEARCVALAHVPHSHATHHQQPRSCVHMPHTPRLPTTYMRQGRSLRGGFEAAAGCAVAGFFC